MENDPLLIGQRVVAILETGQRDATYKLATLMALIEHSIENLPVRSEDTLAIPIPDLAHRVLAIYRRQVRPFQGHDLAQRRTGTKTRIVDATKELRAASRAGSNNMSLEVAMLCAPTEYKRTIDRVALTLLEKLALLHDGAMRSPDETATERLVRGGRHLYDVQRLLTSDTVITVLEAMDAEGLAALCADIDEHSEKAKFSYTPRPARGYGESPLLDASAPCRPALARGYSQAMSLVYGYRPSFDECIETIRARPHCFDSRRDSPS